MRRKIIIIDEGLCDGCGLCIPGCPEGALVIIDGKARLAADFSCDGLGACIGRCPRGAITIEEREAEQYDERRVIGNIARQGRKAVQEHLHHLREHKETESLRIAGEYLRKEGIGMGHGTSPGQACGCPGSAMMDFSGKGQDVAIPPDDGDGGQPSQLRQWPVQLRLISPMAPYYKKADVVLAADCVAFAYGNFHNEFLKNKALAIACPKLDEGQEGYVAKLTALMDEAEINTLTVLTMEVPCCGGLLSMARSALAAAKRKVPVKHIVISLQGGIKSENWVSG